MCVSGVDRAGNVVIWQIEVSKPPTPEHKNRAIIKTQTTPRRQTSKDRPKKGSDSDWLHVRWVLSGSECSLAADAQD